MADDGFEQYDTGQEDYLKGRRLRFVAYTAQSYEWDHDHCAFCWAKFVDSTYPDRFLDSETAAKYRTWLAQTPDLVGCGYTNEGTEDDEGEAGPWWVCEDCYKRFRKRFGWKLEAADWQLVALREAMKQVLLPMTSAGSFHPTAKMYPYRESLGEGLICIVRGGLARAGYIDAPENWERLYVRRARDEVDRSGFQEMTAVEFAEVVRNASGFDPAQPQWACVSITDEGRALDPQRPVGLFGPIQDGDILLPWWRRTIEQALEVLSRVGPDDEPWEMGEALVDLPDDAPDAVLWAFHDAREAEAVQSVVDYIDQIGESLDATDQRSDDDKWFGSPHWPSLARAASEALLLLRASDAVPEPPTADEVIEVLGMVADGASTYDAAVWASRWIAYPRHPTMPDAIWDALEVLRDLPSRALTDAEFAQVHEARKALSDGTGA